MDEGQESRADRLCGGVSPRQWVSNGTRCLARGLTAPCVRKTGDEDVGRKMASPPAVGRGPRLRPGLHLEDPNGCACASHQLAGYRDKGRGQCQSHSCHRP